jgi:hypothetical protein
LELTENEYIFDFGNELAYVTIINNHGEYTMSGGDNPTIIGHEYLPISVFYFIHILSVSSQIVSQGFVTDQAVEFSVFGLDPPQARIFIQPVSGEGTTLLIGSMAPDGNVYVKLDSSPRIYLASFFDVSIFLYSLSTLVDTGITPLAQRNQNEELIFDRIVLGGQVREDFTIVRAEPGLAFSPYRITSPINASVSMDSVAFIEAMFGVYADRFVARISDNRETQRDELNRYGLLQPWSTLELFTAGGNFRILFSRPDNRGMVYIHREGLPIVFEAFASELSWLEASYYDLMDKMVFLPHIDSIASVDIKTPQRTVTFSLSGEENALTVKSGDIDINVTNFRTFYQTLVSARYDEYNDSSYLSLPAPFLEIVYHYRDSARSPDTISFHEASSRRVLTSLNRGRAHFTLSGFTDQILSDLDLVLAGQRVRPFL